MNMRKDENGQGSAELILVVGGMIVIAIAAAVFYKNYLIGLGDDINNTDVKAVTNKIQALKNDF
ncbi:class III signal peptide-containing protein [Methanobacterium aggregans]|uniref:class III signal peptide-containing protein n=1 Tax=Methanobacterium aggregans TaxID=1615586 RepID=UPI001AE87FAD|nr:class III signal peptide-containing protein [Methanobacterium aggregans]MBP2046176.1 hypothetical protein [Methanobacterium aggregans]